MDHARVLDTIAEWFERQGFPFAVVGALALHAYGSTRATVDLDFVTASAAQSGLVGHLEGLGYETLHVSSGYSNHLHADPAWGRVDFVYVDGRTSELLFAGCRDRLTLGGRPLLVPRPEHVAAMKVQAMKNDPSRTLKEMADLQFLLRLPELDEDEVRGYFERSGLRDRYDELKRLS